MKVRTKYYLHSDKDTNYEIGEKLGLKDRALDNFLYAFYEVCFEIEVDTDTGQYTILSVDRKNILL